MVDDDLPTNSDYLDAAFGAAAGLREFSDDEPMDLSDSSVSDLAESQASITGRSTPTAGNNHKGVISSVRGETIRILNPEGIHVVEDYFRNLPEDVLDDAPSE